MSDQSQPRLIVPGLAGLYAAGSCLAWPLILSNSFWTLQITLDRVFLGWRSSNDTAACMAAAMLFWVPTTLLQYTVSYVTTFVAQFHGARQPERVGPVVWQAIALSGVFSVWLWRRQLVRWEIQREIERRRPEYPRAVEIEHQRY